MADRAALLILVEKFFEAGPPVPYATADGSELLRLLPSTGYNPSKCISLSGHQTTRSVIDSHLRRLGQLVGKPDSLLVLLTSRAFSYRRRGYFACADTLPADPVGTSLSVADFMAALHKIRCPEVAVLLDVDLLPPVGNRWDPGLDGEELHRLFEESPTCACMLASEPGKRSYESAQLRRGIWRHHVLEVFSGKTGDGIAGGTVTAAALHSYLADAVPRTLARTYETSPGQSPVLLGEGNAAMVVAEIGNPSGFSGTVLNTARMKRVAFRSESIGRVRDLSGFRKSHSLPDRPNEWARKFVNRIAAADIKADVDRTLDAIRDTFGYRRKDLEAFAGRDGLGFIRTPDFEYTVTILVNPDDPTEVIWRREVGRLSRPALVGTEAFTAVFGPLLDRLVFELATPLDLASLVDRMEQNAPEGASMTLSSGADSAEVRLAGFSGRVILTRQAVVIEGRTGASGGLLDQFLTFLEQFHDIDEGKTLL